MKWSYRIGRFGETEIRLHITLALIVPYVLIQSPPGNLRAGAIFVFLIVCIFGSILLHEMGHTLAARRYGIEVTSITLWPLGGLALLNGQAEKPSGRLLIAAAGPFVNLLLAGVLGGVGVGALLWQTWVAPAWLDVSLLNTVTVTLPLTLAFANLFLAVFNLLPIYPLDGGQIMRSLLQMLVGDRRADPVTLVITLPFILLLVGYGIYQKDGVLIFLSLLLILGASTLNQGLLRLIYLGYAAVANRPAFYSLQGDYERAAAQYTLALQRRPNKTDQLLRRAICYMNFGEYDLARADVERVLEQESNHVLALSVRSDLYYVDGQLDQAMSCCERILEIKPDWAGAYADMGIFQRDRGNLDQALAALDQAIRFSENAVKVYVLRSTVHFRMGNLEQARLDGRRAVEISLKDALIHSDIFLRTLSGYLDWAQIYYGEAAQKYPRSPYPSQGLADACMVNGDLEEALAGYTHALRLAPQDAELYLRRGRVAYQMGDCASAAEDLHKVLGLSKKLHHHRQAEAMLAALGGPAPSLT